MGIGGSKVRNKQSAEKDLFESAKSASNKKDKGHRNSDSKVEDISATNKKEKHRRKTHKVHTLEGKNDEHDERSVEKEQTLNEIHNVSPQRTEANIPGGITKSNEGDIIPVQSQDRSHIATPGLFDIAVSQRSYTNQINDLDTGEENKEINDSRNATNQSDGKHETDKNMLSTSTNNSERKRSKHDTKEPIKPDINDKNLNGLDTETKPKEEAIEKNVRYSEIRDAKDYHEAQIKTDTNVIDSPKDLDKKTKPKRGVVVTSINNSEVRNAQEGKEGHSKLVLSAIDSPRRIHNETKQKEEMVENFSQSVDSEFNQTGTYRSECPTKNEEEPNNQQASFNVSKRSAWTNSVNENSDSSSREKGSGTRSDKKQEQELNDAKGYEDDQVIAPDMSNDVLNKTKHFFRPNTTDDDPNVALDDSSVTTSKKDKEKKHKKKKKHSYFEKSQQDDSLPRHNNKTSIIPDGERINKLERENDKLRVKVGLLESEKDQFVKEIGLLKSEKDHLNKTIGSLKSENDQLNHQMNDFFNFGSSRHTTKLKELREENEELKTRLSKIVSDRVTDGNPNITDLSDQNRPGKLSERFWELYNNEWTEAIDSLNAQGIPEKEAIAILLKIVVDIYTFCRNKAKNEREELVRAIKTFSNCSKMTDELKLSIKLYKDYRKRNYKTAIIMKEGTVKNFLPPGVELTESIDKYIRHGYELCWLMRIQDPPVHLEYDVEEDAPFDKVYFREYMRAGSFCDYVVWPAMCLHKNGPILQKGVMQGTSSKSDEKVEDAN